MFNQLLETKRNGQRRPVGTLVSVMLHLLVVGGALQVTHDAVSALPKPEERRVQFQPLEPTPVTPRTPPSRNAIATQPAPLGHTVLRTPVNVSVDIPAIDLGARPTDPGDFLAAGVPGGRPDGVAGVAILTNDAPMRDFEVDKAAAALPESVRPVYPGMLKSSGVEGDVLVQFVVDTLGRAEPETFKVLTTTHDAFGASVRGALPQMRFIPAESGGTKVRMLVQQRFAFTLDR